MNNVRVLRKGKDVTYVGLCDECTAILEVKQTYIQSSNSQCTECGNVIDFHLDSTEEGKALRNYANQI